MKIIRVYLSYITLAATLLSFANIFFGFLEAGKVSLILTSSSFSFFDLAFSNGSTPLALFSFLFNIIGVISAYFAFLFCKLKKKQFELSYIPSIVAFICFFIALILVCFIPLGEGLDNFGVALILNVVFLAISMILEGIAVLSKFVS